MTRNEILKTAKPILFNTDMVRAIISGTKTVTRRVIKLDSHDDPNEIGYEFVEAMYKPPSQIGDILYVRETWGEDNHNFLYRADFSDTDLEKLKNIMRWRPSIHMPKEVARLFLRVTDVRVERLQDIKIADIISEGAAETCRECFEDYGYGYQCCIGEDDECHIYDEAMSNWQDLWDRTVKKSDLTKYGWAVNPWVWVITFCVVKIKEENL